MNFEPHNLSGSEGGMCDTDIRANCKDCGTVFTISASEQAFYKSKGFELPKRCSDCRAKRRKLRENRPAQDAKNKKTETAQDQENTLNEVLSRIPFEQICLENVGYASPEKALIVVGNGFDIMHGAHSSYWNFQSTIGRNNELRFFMETYLDCQDLWSDLEESLSHLNAGMMLDVVDMWMEDFNAYSPDARAADYFMAIDTAMMPVEVITDKLPKRFRQWVETLTVDPSLKPLTWLMDRRAKYMNFNYTEFLESVYGIPGENIKYIHGCRKKVTGRPKEHLVLGHVPDVDYLENYIPSRGMVPHYKSPRKRNLLESAMDSAATQWLSHYENTFTKKTSEIIRDNAAFFDSLNDITDIIVIGHSLAKVDYPYFMEIRKKAQKNALWHIGYHSPADIERLCSFVAVIGLPYDQVQIFRT